MSADPVTLMLIGSTAMTAMGQIQQSKAAQQSAAYNAQLAERDAEISRQQSAVEEARVRRESARDIGRIRAGISKSGVTFEGTPLLVLAESAEMAELDALNVRWTGENAVSASKSEATLQRMKGASAKKALPFAVGSTLLSGGADIASL